MTINLKIRHGRIVDNVVTYVYAKFGDDRLWNEKALADRKSDSNNTKNKNKNNVGDHVTTSIDTKDSAEDKSFSEKSEN